MSTIALTGLHGEIGSVLSKHIDKATTIVDLFHTSSQSLDPRITQMHIDLLDPHSIDVALEKTNPEVIIHLAGATHIDACEADKIHGRKGKVWQMNVNATERIANYCMKNGTHLIYLSTECVFDGKKELYTEDEKPSPINWYGQTKAAAEAVIQESGCRYSILRAVITYSQYGRATLWQKVVDALKAGSPLVMANDHWITPTYLPDILIGIQHCIEKKPIGIYHIAPSQTETPYSFALKIAQRMGYSASMVEQMPLAKIIGTRKASLRLRYACLDASETERAFGVQFRSVDEVLNNI